MRAFPDPFLGRENEAATPLATAGKSCSEMYIQRAAGRRPLGDVTGITNAQPRRPSTIGDCVHDPDWLKIDGR